MCNVLAMSFPLKPVGIKSSDVQGLVYYMV